MSKLRSFKAGPRAASVAGLAVALALGCGGLHPKPGPSAQASAAETPACATDVTKCRTDCRPDPSAEGCQLATLRRSEAVTLESGQALGLDEICWLWVQDLGICKAAGSSPTDFESRTCRAATHIHDVMQPLADEIAVASPQGAQAGLKPGVPHALAYLCRWNAEADKACKAGDESACTSRQVLQGQLDPSVREANKERIVSITARLKEARELGGKDVEADVKLAEQELAANDIRQASIMADKALAKAKKLDADKSAPGEGRAAVVALEAAIKKCKPDMAACYKMCSPGPTSGVATFECQVAAGAFESGDPAVTKSGPDFKTAWWIYTKGCQIGNKFGCISADDMRKNARECGEVKDCKPYCDAGIAQGCDSVGTAYVEGNGVPTNVSAGVSYYKKGCDLGSGYGCWRLGSAYAKGAGVPRDLDKAHEALKQSCDIGDKIGCGLLERFCLETKKCTYFAP